MDGSTGGQYNQQNTSATNVRFSLLTIYLLRRPSVRLGRIVGRINSPGLSDGRQFWAICKIMATTKVSDSRASYNCFAFKTYENKKACDFYSRVFCVYWALPCRGRPRASRFRSESNESVDYGQPTVS
jgi:hypothetical protein